MAEMKYDGTVGFTGALPGEEIEIPAGKNAGVAPEGLRLYVKEHAIPACPTEKRRDISEDEYRDFLRRSAPQALKPRMENIPIDIKRYSNQSIGSCCQTLPREKRKQECKEGTCSCENPAEGLYDAIFIIKDTGTMINDVTSNENRERLLSWVHNETPVTWKDIRSLVKANRFFYIATFRFKIVETLRPVDTPPTFDTRDGDSGTVWPVLGDTVGLPVTTKKVGDELTKENRVRLLLEDFKDEDGEEGVKEFLIKEFSNGRTWTDGLLKSLIQKAVRYNAKSYRIKGTLVRTIHLASVALAFLLCSNGGYSPNIHKTVRGPVAALKRLAVIAIEDGCPKSGDVIKTVWTFLSVAYILEKRTDYHPTLNIQKAALLFIMRCVKSKSMIAWRRGTGRKEPVSQATMEGIGRLRPLLEALGSFRGDIEMMGVVDKMRQEVYFKSTKSRPSECDIVHIIDQHTTPAFSYALDVEEDTFKARNDAVFNRVTGFNPRIQDAALDEDDTFVAKVRKAQRLVMALFEKKFDSGSPGGRTVSLEYVAAFDNLAGVVGEVEIKLNKARKSPEVLGMLPIFPGREESIVPMLGSSAKNTKEKFLEWQKKENKETRLEKVRKAIEVMRQLKIPLKPSAGRMIDTDRYSTVEYDSEVGMNDPCWGLRTKDGEFVRWETARRTAYDVKLLPPLRFGERFETLKTNDDFVMNSATEGIRENAEEECKALLRQVSLKTILRLKSIMRVQHESFKLPIPARDGGLAADELQAMSGDWDVYRLLVLFGTQVPEALCPGQLPRFKTRRSTAGSRLLKEIVSWIDAVTEERIGKEATGKLTAMEKEKKDTIKPKPHQRDAIDSLSSNGQTNNILTMQAGAGKTYTALWHALYLIPRSTFEFIIWFTPGSAVQDIASMAGKLGMTSFTVPKRNKDGQKRMTEALKRGKHRLYVIDMDMSRDIADILFEMAPRSHFVFDELDSYFGASIRTSIHLALAGAGQSFLGMTATPYANRDDVPRLCQWLSYCVNFPVVKENLIVAMSAAVQITMTHDITKKYSFVEVKMPESLLGQFSKLTDPHNIYTSMRDALNPAFVDQILEIEEPVFVVCDGRDHCERLLGMIAERSGRRAAIFSQEEPGALTDESVSIALVPKNLDRGYNGGARFRYMVRQVYSQGISSRIQMEGRLTRLSQKSKVVYYITVYFGDSSMSSRLDRKLMEEIEALQTAAIESGGSVERQETERVFDNTDSSSYYSDPEEKRQRTESSSDSSSSSEEDELERRKPYRKKKRVVYSSSESEDDEAGPAAVFDTTGPESYPGSKRQRTESSGSSSDSGSSVIYVGETEVINLVSSDDEATD